MGSLHILRNCAVIGCLVLVGCSFTPTYLDKGIPKNAHVYKDEYVIRPSDGPFNEYPKVENAPVLPKGTPTAYYKQSTKGAVLYKLLDGGASTMSLSNTIVPYTEKADACLQQELKDCEPNWVLSIDTNDTYYSRLWGLQKPPGLDVTSEPTPDVKVMVLDTGVYCGHEDITCDKNLAFTAFSDSSDGNGHGTHVSGTIGATGDNEKGVSGVSSRTNIIPAKFLGDNGSGSLFNAIKAIRWAIDNDIDIINCSFGGGGYSQAFQDAINDATKKGILIIGAAGNDGTNNDIHPHYPSNYDNVLSVAAHDSRGARASFSNFGETVMVSAPGRDIFSLYNDGSYRYLSGTSMATPHVTGLAALLYQKYRDLPKPEKRAKTIQEIESSSRPVPYVKYGQVSSVASEPTCKAKKCTSCRKGCNSITNCARQRRCRKKCRVTTNCNHKCQ